MNNIQKTLSLLLLSFIYSCTSDDQLQETINVKEYTKVTAILPDWNLEDKNSRTSITTGTYPTPPSPVWVTGDSIGIYPNAGGDQLSFRINDGGSKTCTFDGGGWAMKSSSYTAYSPFKRSYYYKNKENLPISMLGQTQNGNDNADHLGAYDIQIAKGNKPETGNLVFQFSRYVALIRLEITAPKAATWASVTLGSDASFTTEAKMNLGLSTPTITSVTTSNYVTLNLKKVSTTNENLSIIAYMMLLPVDLTEKTLSIKLTDVDGNVYTSNGTITNNKTFFAANSARWITANDFLKSNIEIDVKNAGSLYTLIPDNQKYSIESLVVSGDINGDDIRYIREMAGFDENGNKTAGKLTNLDLSKANIVAGGNAFIKNGASFWGYDFDGDYKLGQAVMEDMYTTNNSAYYMFIGLMNLKEIILPASLRSLGRNVFWGCHRLKEITIPKNVNAGVWYEMLFDGCLSLEAINVEKGNEILFSKNGCLYHKDNNVTTLIAVPAALKTFTISSDVDDISSYAFPLGNSLEELTVLKDAPELKPYFFDKFYNLKRFVVNKDNERYACIDGILYSKDLKTIECYPSGRTDNHFDIPKGVKKIGFGCFNTSLHLQTISIPEGVEEIGGQAFFTCSNIHELTLPSSVKKIGEAAFQWLHLYKLTCKAVNPPTLFDEWVFAGTYDKIYVPSVSLELYKKADIWKDLNIFGMESEIMAVDLGLSVKWANCNIGANSPEENGNYYAWGEIDIKTNYTSSNSTWWNVKYTDLPLDSEGNLQSAYDASTIEWGNSWRLPTKAELDELKNNCSWKWSKVNGINGYTITSMTNGNSIFLPSNDSSVIDGKDTGFGSYWSSTPMNDTTFDTYGRYAGAIGFYAQDYNIAESAKIQTEYFLRWYKRGIRPVYNK